MGESVAVRGCVSVTTRPTLNSDGVATVVAVTAVVIVTTPVVVIGAVGAIAVEMTVVVVNVSAVIWAPVEMILGTVTGRVVVMTVTSSEMSISVTWTPCAPGKGAVSATAFSSAGATAS